ncbi:unnamed protein product [Amoebophrya sp. A120]|nr:unnamed protein product [Amoebophrya sp. A120]|eukprot:GSA120T00005504001.1
MSQFNSPEDEWRSSFRRSSDSSDGESAEEDDSSCLSSGSEACETYGNHLWLDVAGSRPRSADSDIVSAVKKGDIDAVKRLVEETQPGNERRTLVNSTRHWTEVDYKIGGYTKEWEWHDMTALSYAAYGGHVDVVRYLLHTGDADPTLSGCPVADEYYDASKAGAAGQSKLLKWMMELLSPECIEKLSFAEDCGFPWKKNCFSVDWYFAHHWTRCKTPERDCLWPSLATYEKQGLFKLVNEKYYDPNFFRPPEEAYAVLAFRQKFSKIEAMLEAVQPFWEVASYSNPNYGQTKREVFSNQCENVDGMREALALAEESATLDWECSMKEDVEAVAKDLAVFKNKLLWRAQHYRAKNRNASGRKGYWHYLDDGSTIERGPSISGARHFGRRGG